MNMNWWINKKMGGARQFNSTKWWYTYSFKWWASVLSTQIHSILNPLRSIIKYPYSTYACKPNLNYSFSITEVKVQLWQWIFYFFLAPPPLNWDKKKNANVLRLRAAKIKHRLCLTFTATSFPVVYDSQTLDDIFFFLLRLFKAPPHQRPGTNAVLMSL